MTFQGFPPRAHSTPLPNLFLTSLAPQITDLAELKVTLYVFWLVFQKKSYPRFVTYEELLAQRPIIEGLGGASALRPALDRAVRRGSLLRLLLRKAQENPEADSPFAPAIQPEELFFINNEQSREAVERIREGELGLTLAGVRGKLQEVPLPEPREERPNIFTLYEENIGLLTPLIADELREAEQLYPASWIEEAFREAVRLNKGNWRYISRILERWRKEGKVYGELRRHPEEKSSSRILQRRYGRLLRGE